MKFSTSCCWGLLALLALSMFAVDAEAARKRRRERDRAVVERALRQSPRPILGTDPQKVPTAAELWQRRQAEKFMLAYEANPATAMSGSVGPMPVDVRAFGAIANDGIDDSAAIIACRRAALAAGSYAVYFPAGTYDIDADNVLHPRANGDGTFSGPSPLYGFMFAGDSMSHSILRLRRSPGNPRWLYDSGSAATGVNPGWNRAQFQDLWFQSDLPNPYFSNVWNPTYCADVNGFRIAASIATGGIDKWFTFVRCRHNALGKPLVFSGTSNTDTYTAYSCAWHNCGPLIWENDQAILSQFFGCHWWYPEDCFWIKATASEGSQAKGGSGPTLVYGGDIINEAWGKSITAISNNGSGAIRVTAAGHGYATNDYVVISGAPTATNANNRWQVTRIDDNTLDLQGSTFAATGSSGTLSQGTTPYYVLRIDDGAAWTRHFIFRDCQYEMRQTYLSRLLHKRGESSFQFTNEVLFDGCNMSVNQGAESGADGREYLTIGGTTWVTFRGCAMPERLGIKFYDVTAASVVARQYQPTVYMDNCMVGPTFVDNLATRILYDAATNPTNYGRVINRGARSLSGSLLSERMALDFDWARAGIPGRGEPPKMRFRYTFMGDAQSWPAWSGGLPVFERTVKLTPYSRIVGAGLNKAAGGSGVTLIQYRIGANDKSITYAASGPLRADGNHRAINNDALSPSLFPLDVGTDDNLRRVRLWMGPTEHGGTTSSGTAWIEYE